MRSTLLRTGILAIALIILTATLWPINSGPSQSADVSCAICSWHGIADAVANVILFIPLGALIAVWWSNPAAILAGAALSITIEAVQVQWIPGRDASGFDILFNTAGTICGVILAQHFRTVWREATGFILRTLSVPPGRC